MSPPPEPTVEGVKAPDTKPLGTPKSELDKFLLFNAQGMQAIQQSAQAEQEQIAQQKAKYEEGVDESKGMIKRMRGDTAALAARVKELGAKYPDAPPAPTEPPLPHVKLRPFGESLPGESTSQQLQKTLMTLGLLAQMGMGVAKGHPQGALAAYAGALRGWQEGDLLRAQLEWRDYQEEVAKMQREWQKTWQLFDNKRREFEGQEHRLGMEFTILAAQQGLDREFMNLITRSPVEAMKFLDMQGKVVKDAQQQALDLSARMFHAGIERERMDDEKRRTQIAAEHNAMLRERQGQLNKPLGLNAAHYTNAAGQHPSAMESIQSATEKGFYPFQGKVAPEVATRITLSAVDQALSLVEPLKKKGLLMAQPGAGPWLATTLAREVTQRGDPDLTTFISHTSTLVRTARELGDIGFRAQAAIRGTTDLVEKAQTAGGVEKALRQLRNLLELSAPATMSRKLRVYDTRENKYKDAILDPGETLNDLPEYMDPNR